jgi:hypothetical protein
MSTDIRTRLDALKPPPGAGGTAAATPGPDDLRPLLQMLIDLVAELYVVTKEVQRVAKDAENATARVQRELPTACAQAIRDQVLLLRSQLAELRVKVESTEAHAVRAAVASENCAGRKRNIYIVLGVVFAAVMTAIIIRRLC